MAAPFRLCATRHSQASAKPRNRISACSAIGSAWSRLAAVVPGLPSEPNSTHGQTITAPTPSASHCAEGLSHSRRPTLRHAWGNETPCRRASTQPRPKSRNGSTNARRNSAVSVSAPVPRTGFSTEKGKAARLLSVWNSATAIRSVVATCKKSSLSFRAKRVERVARRA